jgi:Alpha/beta hydrolase
LCVFHLPSFFLKILKRFHAVRLMPLRLPLKFADYERNGIMTPLSSRQFPLLITQLSVRKVYNVALWTPQTPSVAKPVEHNNHLLWTPIEWQIRPHSAGTLEFSGLPIATERDNETNSPSIIAMSQGNFHKIVLKVGPDAADVSNGIGLWLLRQNETAPPQAGFVLKTQDENGNLADLIIPGDGKITLAANSPLWEKITSIKGLTIFLACNTNITLCHSISLQLLKKQNWHELESVRLGGLSILPVSVAVDANRDGEITYDASDSSSAGKPYMFWINDDRDIRHKVDPLPAPVGHNGDWEEDDVLAEEQILPDSRVPGIHYLRDLEDFTRIWIDFRAVTSLLGVSPSNVSLKARFDVDSGNPMINLFEACESDGGIEYLKNPLTAQTLDEHARELCQITGGASAAIPARAWSFGSGYLENEIHLLFEGVQDGDGNLVFELWQNGEKLCDLPPLYLRLRKAHEFYETWTVGDTMLENSSNNYDVWPSAAAEYHRRSGRNLANPTTAEEKNYIMFVHGWNMTNIDKNQFADTMFKRLWHQGFKGRFGAFRWPTFYTPAIDFNNFNASEQRAWNSASPLAALLQNRSAIFQLNGKSQVRLFGHSMGNIVCSEALRLCHPQTAPIHTYISGQAAIAAHCWDSREPESEGPRLMDSGSLNTTTANVYRNYWQPSAGADSPRLWQEHNRPSYLHQSYMPSDVKYINHYNRGDWALKSWELNQKLKPFYGYNYTVIPNVNPDIHFYKNHSLLTCPADRYEIFSWIAEARSYATGAEPATKGLFSEAVDLSAEPFFFDDKHKGHSAQFRSNIQKRWLYWQTFLDNLNIPFNQ